METDKDLIKKLTEDVKKLFGEFSNIKRLFDLAEIKFRQHKHEGLSDEKMNTEIVTVPMSFETGEQTATKIYFPYAVQIKRIRGIVTKALAATNSGTITGANSAGNSTAGVITALASAALDTEYSVNPTDNNLVGKDSYYKLTSAKVTAGGKILVTLEVERI